MDEGKECLLYLTHLFVVVHIVIQSCVCDVTQDGRFGARRQKKHF